MRNGSSIESTLRSAHSQVWSNSRWPDSTRGADGFAFDRYGVRVPTLLVSPWIAAGTVLRSPSPTLKFDHTSIVATLLGWCGVAPEAAGLGDRVAVAQTFDAAFAQQVREDIPTFGVPDGYAKQGSGCWIIDEAQRLPVGLGCSLVTQSATIEGGATDHRPSC